MAKHFCIYKSDPGRTVRVLSYDRPPSSAPGMPSITMDEHYKELLDEHWRQGVNVYRVGWSISLTSPKVIFEFNCPEHPGAAHKRPDPPSDSMTHVPPGSRSDSSTPGAQSATGSGANWPNLSD